VDVVNRIWYRKTMTDYERLKHIRIMERNDYRNNIIERIQGTIRERIKVMRGFRGFHNPFTLDLLDSLP